MPPGRSPNADCTSNLLNSAPNNRMHLTVVSLAEYGRAELTWPTCGRVLRAPFRWRQVMQDVTAFNR